MEQVTSMKKPLFLRAADREQTKRRAQYRYKTTEHVQNRKHKRDEDGFFIPFAMFRPYNGSGLLCEVLGTTPARRMADLRVLQDYLMKEAYEHEIEMLMCQMRLHEFAFHRHFCAEDRAEERYARKMDGAENADAEAPEMTAPDTRQVILNAVTWRYQKEINTRRAQHEQHCEQYQYEQSWHQHRHPNERFGHPRDQTLRSEWRSAQSADQYPCGGLLPRLHG